MRNLRSVGLAFLLAGGVCGPVTADTGADVAEAEREVRILRAAREVHARDKARPRTPWGRRPSARR